MNKRIFTIADCFSFIKNGANIKQDKEKRGYPITRIETTSNNVFNRDKVGYAGIEDITPYQDYVLEDGDLLMSHINSLPYLGRVVYYDRRQDEVIIHGMNLLRLKAIKTRLRPKYATFLFSSIRFKNKILTIAKKSVNQASFSINDLKKVCIELPTVEEQDNIVYKLVGIQKIIQLRNTQLMKLDALVKCRFVELFGNPVVNPKNWPKQDLASYIDFMTSGSRGWSKFFSNNGKYFITIKNVKGGKVSTASVQYVNPPNNAEAIRTKLKEGDLLISITADLGRTGVVSKEIADYGAYINQHLTCVRLKPETLHPLYTAYFLETEAGKLQFSSKNQNAVKAGLNFDSIKSLQILVPPRPKQETFVTFVSCIDKLRFDVQAALEKAQTLFDSLMQEYFG